MILYFDIYIDDAPLVYSNIGANEEIRSACSQYKMPRKLDIAKYTLASYAMIKWSHVVIKFDAKIEEDATSFLAYAKRIFPMADISRPCSSDYLSYKKTVEMICNLGDDWIFYAPNNDHPLIASNLDHLYKALEKATKFSEKYEFVSIIYSHLSEFINAPIPGSPFYICHSHDSRIVENSDTAISFVRFNGDNSSCQIVNRNLLRYWFCSHNLGNERIIRAEDVRQFFLTKNQLMIVLKKELCAHFDGYAHTIGSKTEILPDQVPPLFIPSGFFENKIKIRYGYDTYLEGWVNINPAAKYYSFRANQECTDLMWTLNDIPLFWKGHISEIDANPLRNDKYLKKMRDEKYKVVLNPWNGGWKQSVKYFLKQNFPILKKIVKKNHAK